jgi:FkbM family methyltransferase
MNTNAPERMDHVVDSFHAFAHTFNETVKCRDALIPLIPKSRGQVYQDLIALMFNNFKTNGFFVEFGGCEGYNISNTYLLEKEFGWTGIVAEPAKYWHTDLVKNRACHIDFDCVWTESNKELLFNETTEASIEFSTIDLFSSTDQYALRRIDGTRYPVNTISLADLLKKYNAPAHIDYLSIDTEGSEFEILNSFDFDQYQINVITCEHNYSPNRELIYNLLTSKGYKRIFNILSQWDDWYILGE